MPRTSCIASFGLLDVNAQYDASYASADAQSFVNFEEFNFESGIVPPKIATLEDDYFWLDGTFDLFPDDPTELNYIYWSESMSDENGDYSGGPLEIQFTRQHSSIGLMLRFYEPTNDYPDHIEVRWYNSVGALISRGRYHPDSATCIVSNPVDGYQRIEIDFLHTNNPYRFIKLLEIGYGLEKVFGEDEIVSAKILEQLNPVSTELPYNTLSLTVHSEVDEFNPLNPQGLFSYLQEKQAIDVTEIIDDKSIYMGRFYLDRWEAAEDNSLTMVAIDLLGVMDQSNFMGGMYTNYPATQLVDDIMTSANADYVLSPDFDGITLSGHLSIMTHRQAIQQMAIAIGAVADCSRSDVLNIVPPPANPSMYIPKSRKITGGKIKLKQLVTGVTVVAHKFLTTNTQREILNDELATGEYEIIFPSPMFNLNISGGTILNSNVNRALIRSGGGTVILTGYEYIDSQKPITTRMALPSGASKNVLEIKTATLVSESNAKAVSKRVFQYHQQRYENNFGLLPGTERVGDHVVVDSLRSEKLRGNIESMAIDSTGGFLSNVKLSGIWIETFDGNYTGEFWTNEQIGVL